MAVSYDGLFAMLKARGMKKKDLCELTGMSYSTLRKLSNGENMQMNVLEKICLKMDCKLADIAEIVPEEKR